jgi:hypothetical protein
MNVKRVGLGLVVVAVVAALAWVAVMREQWGTDLGADPAYRNGRESLCKMPPPMVQGLPSAVRDLGVRPVGSGFERTQTHTFDTAGLAGGVIEVCSEYGFVQVLRAAGAEGRVEVTVSSPFPHGDDAMAATLVATELGVSDGRLHVRVAQRTQGVTSFRSLVRRGSRPANVNVIVQVPGSGPYELHLVANHQRITIRDLDISGVLQGYASPGADIDAGVVGDLEVRLSGVTYQAKVAGSGSLQGGTAARLRPLRSGSLGLAVDQGPLRLELAGLDLGLDVTASGTAGHEIDIGPTDSSRVDGATVQARSAGFDRATVQVAVRVSSASGSVSVKRSSQ